MDFLIGFALEIFEFRKYAAISRFGEDFQNSKFNELGTHPQ